MRLGLLVHKGAQHWTIGEQVSKVSSLTLDGNDVFMINAARSNYHLSANSDIGK